MKEKTYVVWEEHADYDNCAILGIGTYDECVNTLKAELPEFLHMCFYDDDHVWMADITDMSDANKGKLLGLTDADEYEKNGTKKRLLKKYEDARMTVLFTGYTSYKDFAGTTGDNAPEPTFETPDANPSYDPADYLNDHKAQLDEWIEQTVSETLASEY